VRGGQREPDAREPAAHDARHQRRDRGTAAHVGEHRQAARGPPPGRGPEDGEHGDRAERRPPASRRDRHDDGDADDLEDDDRRVGDGHVTRVQSAAGHEPAQERDARGQRRVGLQRAGHEGPCVGAVDGGARHPHARGGAERQPPSLGARQQRREVQHGETGRRGAARPARRRDRRGVPRTRPSARAGR
jgi:hypothetical protein